MRLLADENFPRPAIQALREAGHDVIWARTQYPGLKDATLLQHAEAEERILLTLDKDFWQIAVLSRSPIVRSGVVLFRVHQATPRNLGLLVRAFMAAPAEWTGHISIIAPDGVQMVAAGASRRRG